MGQVVLQSTLLPAGDLVVVDGLLELREVVQPLLTALGAEHLLIAACIEHGGEDFRNGPLRIVRGEALDEGEELLGLGALEEAVPHGP
jgi:hypothetical protein